MQPIDPAERIKMIELQTEIKNDSNKVEWIYSGDRVDKSAYLLGKPIDKVITEAQENEAKQQQAFSSTVDLANKIREDPLFEIKKQEIESKKRLLENPMKLKQLKELISKQSGSKKEEDEYDYRESRKLSKKHRKHKSRSRSVENRRRRETNSRSRSRSAENRRRRESNSRSRSRNRDRPNNDYYGYNRKQRSRSKSKNKEMDEKKREKIEEINRVKRKIEEIKKIRDTSNKNNDYKNQSGSTKKMSEEERQRKLREMTENAKWRNETRDKNIKKYKKDDLKDDEETKNIKGEPTEMFHSMMRDAYVSAEDRIKRNMRNIQRNTSEYEKNFARK